MEIERLHQSFSTGYTLGSSGEELVIADAWTQFKKKKKKKNLRRFYCAAKAVRINESDNQTGSKEAGLQTLIYTFVTMINFRLEKD